MNNVYLLVMNEKGDGCFGKLSKMAKVSRTKETTSSSSVAY